MCPTLRALIRGGMNGEETNFWAKTTEEGQPGISVRDHCLNVGCVAEALRGLLPSEVRALLPPETLLLVAEHDIGKITVGFQKKCPVWLAASGFVERANRAGWQFSESNHAAVGQDFFLEPSPDNDADLVGPGFSRADMLAPPKAVESALRNCVFDNVGVVETLSGSEGFPRVGKSRRRVPPPRFAETTCPAAHLVESPLPFLHPRPRCVFRQTTSRASRIPSGTVSRWRPLSRTGLSRRHPTPGDEALNLKDGGPPKQSKPKSGT